MYYEQKLHSRRHPCLRKIWRHELPHSYVEVQRLRHLQVFERGTKLRLLTTSCSSIQFIEMGTNQHLATAKEATDARNVLNVNILDQIG